MKNFLKRKFKIQRVLPLIIFSIFIYSGLLFSDCPDWVDCCTKPNMDYVGSFQTPTCFNFWNQECKPAYCKDKKHDHQEQCKWDRECKKRFPEKCKNGCSANFPTFNLDKKDCADGWTPCGDD